MPYIIFVLMTGFAQAEDCGVAVSSFNKYLVKVTNSSTVPLVFTTSNGDSFQLQKGSALRQKMDFDTPASLSYTVPEAWVTSAVKRAEEDLEQYLEEQLQLKQEIPRLREELSEKRPAMEVALKADRRRREKNQIDAEAKQSASIERYRKRNGGLTPSQARLVDSCYETQREVAVRGPDGRDFVYYETDWSFGCSVLEDSKYNGHWEQLAEQDYSVHVDVDYSPAVLEYRKRSNLLSGKSQRAQSLTKQIASAEARSNSAHHRCSGERNITAAIETDGVGYAPILGAGLGLGTGIPDADSQWGAWSGVTLHASMSFPVASELRLGRGQTVFRPYLSVAIDSDRAALAAGTISQINGVIDEVDDLHQYNGDVVLLYRTVPVGLFGRLFFYPRIWIDLGGGVNVLRSAEYRLDADLFDSEGESLYKYTGADLGDIEPLERLTSGYASLSIARTAGIQLMPKLARFHGTYFSAGYRVSTRPQLSLSDTMLQVDSNETVINPPKAGSLGHTVTVEVGMAMGK